MSTLIHTLHQRLARHRTGVPARAVSGPFPHKIPTATGVLKYRGDPAYASYVLNAIESGGHPFYFLGNLPCLDFVNTRSVSRGSPVDLLAGFTDLLRWLQAGSLITPPEARAAEKRWENSPEGKAVFREAVSLRNALRTVAERLAAGRPADRASIEPINRVLASRPAYRQLELKGSKVVSQQHTISESSLHLLVPIAESAAWLLEYGDMSLVRRCENPDCILFFYDTTKNKRRRWCSMDACGSRAKAAAYYRRSRTPKRRRLS